MTNKKAVIYTRNATQKQKTHNLTNPQEIRGREYEQEHLN